MLFLDKFDNWRVASQKGHIDAGKDLCYLQAKNLGKKAPVGTNAWYIYDGSKWNVSSRIKSTRVFDVEEILEAMKYQEKMRLERERIMESCLGFEIQGMVGSAGQKCLNSVYRKIPDLMHCGKPVYEFLNGGKECFAEKVTDIVCITILLHDGVYAPRVNTWRVKVNCVTYLSMEPRVLHL